MSEKKRALSDEELEEVRGGLTWGPFNDAVVPCYWCKENVVIYRVRAINCPHCGGLLRASLYE